MRSPLASPLLRLGRSGSCFGSPLEKGDAYRLPARLDSSSAASSSLIRSSFAARAQSFPRSSSWSPGRGLAEADGHLLQFGDTLLHAFITLLSGR
jgi:hypothetical protein